jgi:hypothetical protein
VSRIESLAELELEALRGALSDARDRGQRVEISRSERLEQRGGGSAPRIAIAKAGPTPCAGEQQLEGSPLAGVGESVQLDRPSLTWVWIARLRRPSRCELRGVPAETVTR